MCQMGKKIPEKIILFMLFPFLKSNTLQTITCFKHWKSCPSGYYLLVKRTTLHLPPDSSINHPNFANTLKTSPPLLKSYCIKNCLQASYSHSNQTIICRINLFDTQTTSYICSFHSADMFLETMFSSFYISSPKHVHIETFEIFTVPPCLTIMLPP